MTDYKPPKPAPGDLSHLQRLINTLSRHQGIAEDRLRRWVSTMVLLGALDRTSDADEHRFVLKSGVALELRLRLRARATKDVDLFVIADADDMLELLQDALEQPHLDFDFRVANVRAIRGTPAQRMDIKMTYKRKSWATLQLEVSPPEAGAAETELIAGISITELGLDGPEQVACQAVRYQAATKLHAVTERFEDRENDRFRDLIDLQLLRDLQPDIDRVADACEEIRCHRRSSPRAVTSREPTSSGVNVGAS